MNFMKNALHPRKNPSDETPIDASAADVEGHLLGVLQSMNQSGPHASSRAPGHVPEHEAVSTSAYRDAAEGDGVDSSRQELSRILEAIRAQPHDEAPQKVDLERLANSEVSPTAPHAAAQVYEFSPAAGSASEVSQNAKLSQKLKSGDAAGVALALDEVTAAVDRVLSTLPNKADAAQTWESILDDMRELAKRRQRLVEIEQEFEATMAQIEAVIASMNEHLQQTIVAEKERIYSFQVRAKLAETLSVRLREI